MSDKRINKTSTLAQAVMIRLAIVAVALLVIMMVVQGVILASAGTIGPEITATRNQTRQIQVDNELRLAEIRELQTSDSIMETITNDLAMGRGDLQRVGEESTLAID